jgi:glutamine amidotransferase
MLRIAIIDYGSGNLRSAAKAFERVSAGKAAVTVTNNPKALAKATHIVLPGVGAFADCMRGLEAVPGMRTELEKQVLEARKPFLGVCVGMQMLFDTGHEHGLHKGLGWIKGEVVKMVAGCELQVASDGHTRHATRNMQLKIPHMGWNDLTLKRPEHPLLAGLHTGDHAYFVHSYHAVCDDGFILATTDYGGLVTAIVAKNNIMGTQFHPEKSQSAGLRLIGNFLGMA